jgi:hypothetical protein
MSDLKKARLGLSAMNDFFQQFGELQEQDVIVLSYIFELLYNSEEDPDAVSLSGEEE